MLKSWIAILIGLFLCFIGKAQFHGDVNADGIIDATDYYNLKESILNNDFKSSTDINTDGVTNVSDLMILENYLYREGESNFIKKEKKDVPPVLISPGKINTDSLYIDILLDTEIPVAAFEFSIAGVESVERVVSGEAKEKGQLIIRGNKILFTPGIDKMKTLSSRNMLKLKVKIPGNKYKICITQPVVVNEEGHSLPVKIGECASRYYTLVGLEEIKKEVAKLKEPQIESDLNEDGYTDLVDAYQLGEFVLGNGKIPGYEVPVNGKLKLEITEIDLDNNLIYISSKTSVALSSFQFSLSGVDSIAVVGGQVLDNELQIMINQRMITTFLGQGNPIMPDKDNIMIVKYLEKTADQVCVVAPMFLSSNGEKVNVKIGDCVSLIKIIPGCMDSLALNYNPEANKEDGSCEYPPKPKKEKEVKEKKEKEVVEENREQKNKKDKKDEKDNDEELADNKNVDKKKDKKEAKEKKSKEEKEDSSKKDKQDQTKSNEKQKEQREKDKKEQNKPEEIEEKPIEEKPEEVKEENFDLNKVKSGYFIPEVTSDQRKKIENPEKGLMVYDKEIGNLVIFDGKDWQVVKGSEGSNLKKIKKAIGFWKTK